jgi:hypothetical protein
MEDFPTLEGESSMVLDGLAVGVDHLEAIIVFYLGVTHAYASWVRAGVDLKPGRVGNAVREAYLASEHVVVALDGDPPSRPQSPVLTIETQGRIVFVHRVRTFGVAVCFERDAPLGFARMAARQIVRTLEHDLPYAHTETAVVVLAQAKATVPGSSQAPGQLDFDGDEHAPDTSPPPRAVSASGVGDRVRAILRHLEENGPDPHLIRLRVALRSGLGLDAVDHPDHLSAESVLLVETAAEDILGIEHGKLTEVARQPGANVP